MIPGFGAQPHGIPTVLLSDGDTDVDVHSLLGSPATKAVYMIIIQAGTTVNGSARSKVSGGWTDSVAIDASAFATDSLGYYIIKGNVFGCGGRGGDGCVVDTVKSNHILGTPQPGYDTWGGGGGGGGAGYPPGDGGDPDPDASAGVIGDDIAVGPGPWNGGSGGSNTWGSLWYLTTSRFTTNKPDLDTFNIPQDGGDAIRVSHSVRFYNAGGKIWAGGGGGTGGESVPSDTFVIYPNGNDDYIPAGEIQPGVGGGPGENGQDGTVTDISSYYPLSFPGMQASGFRTVYPGSAGRAVYDVSGVATITFSAGSADPLVKGTVG